MPIENEVKYLLPVDFDASTLAGWQMHDIRQAYLDDGPRIRQIDADYVFTYKKWIPQAKELVEIETGLSRDDFDLLWSQRVESLEKTRYTRQIGEAEWVVDFLRESTGRVYLVLAEVELPRHKPAPDAIPQEIAPHILHTAEAGDIRFTNRKLSDPAFAAGLYDRIRSGA